jgi:PAS domain S-box-containing protein
MKDEEKAREQHVSEPSANRQRLPASGEADLSGNRPEEDLLGAEVTTLAILNTTVDGIIIIDAGGIIQSFNPAAERIFGYAADEVIGKSVNLLMPSPYREEHDDHLRRYLTTGEKRIIGIGREVVGLRKDGTVFPMDLAVSEVRLGDRRLFTGIVRDVTERKQAEEVLKKSHRELQQTKQYLERLIESSPDAIVSTDREGSITFFSPGAEKLLGYHLEEIIGQRVTALYESEEQAKEVMSQMRSQGGTVSAFETTIRSKDGSLIPVLISASILYDEEGQEAGTVGFNKDLRERKQAEEVLRESEERFRSVAQSAIDAIISADGRGNIVSWNRGAQTIFGYTEEEVLGEPLTLLMPERYREAHQSGLERMQSTGESRVIGKTVELHGLRKDGSEFPLALSLATWQGGGGGILFWYHPRHHRAEEGRRGNALGPGADGAAARDRSNHSAELPAGPPPWR